MKTFTVFFTFANNTEIFWSVERARTPREAARKVEKREGTVACAKVFEGGHDEPVLVWC